MICLLTRSSKILAKRKRKKIFHLIWFPFSSHWKTFWFNYFPKREELLFSPPSVEQDSAISSSFLFLHTSNRINAKRWWSNRSSLLLPWSNNWLSLLYPFHPEVLSPSLCPQPSLNSSLTYVKKSFPVDSTPFHLHSLPLFLFPPYYHFLFQLLSSNKEWNQSKWINWFSYLIQSHESLPFSHWKNEPSNEKERNWKTISKGSKRQKLTWLNWSWHFLLVRLERIFVSHYSNTNTWWQLEIMNSFFLSLEKERKEGWRL